MKRIACIFPARSKSRRLFLVLVLGTLAAVSASPSVQPKYGGTLRVQMSARVTGIDPRQWPSDSEHAAAAERIANLVFDRLVRFDDHGAPAPALALFWQHDDQNQRWEFRLRQGIKFSNGAEFTPEAAALALQQLLGNAFEVSATADAVVIQSDHPVPNLPAELAGGRYFIFRAADDGAISGTGPFRVTQWPAGATAKGGTQKITLAANRDCWAGRPFVDQVEITVGASAQQQANAVAFDQADVVELVAAQQRPTEQRGVRTVASNPVDVYALEFDLSQPAAQDARIREAVSLALDRASLADVILQRQGVASGALLPNWLSGYALLLPGKRDLTRAKDLLSASRAEVSRLPVIELNYDLGDSSNSTSINEARAISERVAINLHEAGIIVHLAGNNLDGATKASAPDPKNSTPVVELRLVRRHISGPDAQLALRDMLASFGESAVAPATAQESYDAERQFVASFRVIPLVTVSENYGLGMRVRDWMAPRWGGWRLEDVWLAQPEAADAGSAIQ